MCNLIQVWEYGRMKYCPIFCYVILEHAVDFEF
jgi:hypothetical protein